MQFLPMDCIKNFEFCQKITQNTFYQKILDMQILAKDHGKKITSSKVLGKTQIMHVRMFSLTGGGGDSKYFYSLAKFQTCTHGFQMII